MRFKLADDLPGSRGTIYQAHVLKGKRKVCMNVSLLPVTFQRILKMLSGSYIVIDSAPLIPFAEGIQLSRKVDGVVLVVRSATTKHAQVQRVLALLDDAGAKVLGSVLNGRRFYIPKFIYNRL